MSFLKHKHKSNHVIQQKIEFLLLTAIQRAIHLRTKEFFEATAKEVTRLIINSGISPSVK